MKTEAKLIFELLKKEITICHYYWIMYRQILGTSENQIEIINKTNPSFFSMFHNLLIDYITLELSKLTDPANVGKNKNLSLHYLLLKIQDEIIVDLNKDLIAILENLKNVTVSFRKRRNKKVAHFDSQIQSSQVEFKISRKNIEDALLFVRNFMNKIELHFFKSQTLYSEFITNSKDDGTALLINLTKSLAYDDLVNKKQIHFRLWEQYGKVFN
jgi:hypothetical protein